MFFILVVVLIVSLIIAYASNMLEYETISFYSTNLATIAFLSIMAYIIGNIFYRVLSPSFF
jgi:hypothetical protein